MKQLLSDQTILITGGSRGIGLEVARECARQGARLILVSRHQTGLIQAVASLDKPGATHCCMAADVSCAEAVRKLAQNLQEENVTLDGLVNCAGILTPIGKTSDIDPAAFIQNIQTNFLGTFHMCRVFYPLLRRPGKIVNFSGGGATRPFPFYSAYAAGKAAVVRFTENLAYEFRDDDITVNAVSPGFVATRIHEATLEAGERAGHDYLEKTRHLLKEGGVPAEKSARLTAFLLSQESDGISGKLISAVWDPWENPDFQTELKNDPDLATLRRIDGVKFFNHPV